MSDSFALLTGLKKDNKVIEQLSKSISISKVFFSLEELNNAHSELIILYSFPHILSENFINRQRLVLNVHNSLLPKYRGRHAFTWALINGEDYVGYSIHKVIKRIDAGDVYAQLKIKVTQNDDINSLFKKSDRAIVDWLPIQLKLIANGKLFPKPQNDSLASYYPLRTFSDMEIKLVWNKSQISNFIKAHTPPYTKGAYIKFENKYIHVDKILASYKKGEIFSEAKIVIFNNRLILNCLDSTLEINIVKIEKANFF